MLALAIANAAILSGCASLPVRQSAWQQPLPLPESVSSYYAYPTLTQTPLVLPIEQHSRYEVYLVRFPLSLQESEPTEPVVEIEWFLSKQPGKRPAVIVNPILGGDYPLERAVSRYFSARGYHVALIHRKTLKISPEHDISHLEFLLRQGVIRIRQVVDWLTQQESVDAAQIGSFGISMGGIAAVMAAAVEPRLKAHTIALAGGGIVDILMHSNDKLLSKPRLRYLAHHRMDLNSLELALRREVKTDPIRLAPYVQTRDLYLFIALTDATMGRSNALRLWQALGKPQATFMLTGHYTSYLLLPYVKWQSLRFFRKHLAD